MGIHHNHQHAHHHINNSSGLKWAFTLNLLFAFIELGGGLWTNSLAIMADAVHDFGDALAIGLALILEHYGNKNPDEKYTYGYRRYSLLGAVLTGVILTVSSLLIIRECIERFQHPQDVKPLEMIGFALLGMAVNGYSAWRLSRSSGVNQRMAMLHLLEDVIGWAVIFVSAIIMLIYPMPILDSILSMALSIFVLWNVIKMSRKILRIFMQRMPEEIEMSRLHSEIGALTGVRGMHAMQGWSLDGEEHTFSTHIKVGPETDFKSLMDLKCKIKDIFSHHKIKYSTIEFESSDDCCLDHDHTAHTHK